MRRRSRSAANLRAIRTAVYILLFLNCFRQKALAQDPNSPIPVARVSAPGMVVSDMDRAVTFYSQALTFEKVSDVEVFGDEYEHLEGLFGIRMHVVRLRLGNELVELKEFLAPQGRP